jgi:endoglucanase
MFPLPARARISAVLKALLYPGLIAWAALPAAAALSPVAANGKLHVSGTFLVNQRGDTVQLRGVATHGMQWFNSFYGDGAAIEAAADQWGADVIRLTVYTSEGGYVTSKTIAQKQFDDWIDAYVNAAVKRGVYIILDWHVHKPGYPGYYLAQAKAFFAKMTGRYGTLPNVLYEICNEPSSAGLTDEQSDGTGTDAGHYVEWSEIVQYANDVIPLIRKSAPDAVVLIGTPSWSTLGVSTKGNNAWQQIADNKPAFPNLMYVIHYYAASHTFQAAFESASAKLPLFATEWATAGFQETSANDEAKGQAFVDMLKRRRISWAYWNYSNNTPGIFSVFDKSTAATGPFAPGGSNVTPTGKLVYKWLSEPADGWKDYAVSAGNVTKGTDRPNRGIPVFEARSGGIVLRIAGGNCITVLGRGLAAGKSAARD